MLLDSGVSLRYLLLAATWALTVALGILWAVFEEPAIAQGGIVALTLACTLNILNDNARTRRIVRACLREAADGRDDGRPLTPVR